LQVAAALLALVPYFSPWAAKHRNYALLVVVVVIGWIAKPRLEAWIKRRRYLRHDQHFVTENAAMLRRLVERFAIFTSNHDTRSLIQILRSAYSQNMVAATTHPEETPAELLNVTVMLSGFVLPAIFGM
jgi:hypothetical protein